MSAGDQRREVRRPPWSEFRAALTAVGFRPSRRLGQSFLLDDAMARAIARDGGVGPGEIVLEIGSGCGFLSCHLLGLGVRLVALEVDERLVRVSRTLLEPLERELPGAALTLVHADALAGRARLSPELLALLPAREPWSVVSNLPYSIGGTLLAALAGLSHPPRQMTVLVQREVAQRLAAAPGERARGPLGVKLELRYRARIVRAVPARLFWPVPEVESALCRLELRADRPDPGECARFEALVDTLFQQRRKTLRASLARLAGRERAEARLACAGIDPMRRPETLARDELLALVRCEVDAQSQHQDVARGPASG